MKLIINLRVLVKKCRWQRNVGEKHICTKRFSEKIVQVSRKNHAASHLLNEKKLESVDE